MTTHLKNTPFQRINLNWLKMFSGAIYYAISSDGYFSLAQSGCPVVFLDFRLFPVGFLPSSTFSGGFFPWLSPNYGCYFWKPPWPSLYLNLLKFSFEGIFYKSSPMGDNLRQKMQKITLGVDDEPVALPPSMCIQAAESNRFSLVVVPLNPRKQNLRAMIGQLPRVWGVDNSVVGRIIAPNKVQFIFQSEEALLMVTRRAP